MAAQPCHRAVTQGVAAPQVVVEHAALLRHWAGLQERVSRQAQEQARRCAALEAELMHCRARWVLATTQMLWGLGWPGAAPPRPTAVAPAGTGYLSVYPCPHIGSGAAPAASRSAGRGATPGR